MTNKKWYQSKTMWANLIVVVTAIVTGVEQYAPQLAGIVTAQHMGVLLFASGVANMFLRAITTTGITK